MRYPFLGLGFGIGLGLNPFKGGGAPTGALVLSGLPLLLDGGFLILTGA